MTQPQTQQTTEKPAETLNEIFVLAGHSTINQILRMRLFTLGLRLEKALGDNAGPEGSTVRQIIAEIQGQ